MADIQALIERLRWADRHRIQAARGRRIFREAADELTRLSARVEELEDNILANRGVPKAPCFICGYNGPDYYQPGAHSCVARYITLATGGDTTPNGESHD